MELVYYTPHKLYSYAALRQIDAVTSNALSPDMVNDANSFIDNASSAEELIDFLYKMGAE